MEAYILGTLPSNKTKNHGGVRILDLSPTAKVRVIDADYNLVYQKIKSGALQLQGITVDNSGMKYYGMPLHKAVPKLNDEMLRINPLMALKIVIRGGVFAILLSDMFGNTDMKLVKSFIENKSQRIRVFNTKIIPGNLYNNVGNVPTFIVNEVDSNTGVIISSKSAVIALKNNKPLLYMGGNVDVPISLGITIKKSNNINKNTEKSVEVLDINKEFSKVQEKKEEQLNPKKWPSILEFKNLCNSKDIKFVISDDELTGYIFSGVEDTQTSLIIPHGVIRVESLLCDKWRFPYHSNRPSVITSKLADNGKLKFLGIPNTVLRIDNEAFNDDISSSTKIIIEDFPEYDNPDKLDKVSYLYNLKQLSFLQFSEKYWDWTEQDFKNLIPNNIPKITSFTPRRLQDINSTYSEFIVDLSDKNIYSIEYSCSSEWGGDMGSSRVVAFLNLPNTVRLISDSFSYYLKPADFGIEELRLPDEVRDVCKSYTHMNIKKINLGNCKHLKNIVRSFNNMPNLEEVDLSGCIELEDIYDCFNDCPKIKVLKLPPHLKTLRGANFYSSPNLDLSTVDFPESLDLIQFGTFRNSYGEAWIKNKKMSGLPDFSENTIIHWNTDKITKHCFRAPEYKGVLDLPECESISYGVFEGSNLGDYYKVKIGKPIKSIGD